ncbi:unnamed protein product [Effrenium voratum]|nr:unnamed protein product [Effrenium voratum]
MGCRVSAALKRLELMTGGASRGSRGGGPGPAGPEPPVAPARLGRELRELLEASNAMGPEQKVGWQRWLQQPAKEVEPPPWQKLCYRSSLLLAEGAQEAASNAAAEVAALRPLPVQPLESMPWLQHLCCLLEALDAVLCLSGSLAAAEVAEEVFPKLDEVWEVLRRYAKIAVLKPTLPETDVGALRAARLCAGDLGAATPRAQLAPLCEAALRLPLQILARCTPTGPEAVTGQDLLELANGDLSLAVFCAVSALRAPGLRASGRLKLRVWQLLQELSTFQFFASEISPLRERSDETPLQDFEAQHPGYAHGLALCLLQADALEACCDLVVANAEATQRVGVIIGCLRMLHSLSASDRLWASGRLLARRIAVLWPRFGYRVLAPHLRRLAASEAGAQGELRRDLRTLAWLLYHAPELAELARPLAAEMALRLLKGSPETLAVAIAAAANAGALTEGTLLDALSAMESTQKEAVQQRFPEETNQRLWIVEAAWPVIEELGLWPAEEDSEAAEKRRADIEAIAKLTPEVEGFNSVLPGGVDEAKENWGDDWEAEQQQAEAAQTKADKPCSMPITLGALGVPLPGPQSLGSRSQLFAHLCSSPSELHCSLDGRLCTEPVLAAPGGELLDVLFQRSSILCWLSQRQVCPVTGVALHAEDLLPAVDRCAALLLWAARQ